MIKPLPFLRFALPALAGLASAAVPGTPEPPRPGRMPSLWLSFGNDFLGLNSAEAEHSDDFRTSHWTLAATACQWVAVADYAMLTDRGAGTRSDELTLTVGRIFTASPHRDEPWVAVGGGARFAGNLKGQNLQTEFHDLINYEPTEVFSLDYDHDQWSAAVYAQGSMPWWPHPNGGGEIVAALLATSEQEIQAEIATHLVARSRLFQAQAWCGGRWRGRNGEAAGATAEAVASFERGWWLDFGVSIHFLSFQGAYDPRGRESYGTVSIAVDF